MDEKKELNDEEIEKVSGGLKNARLYGSQGEPIVASDPIKHRVVKYGGPAIRPIKQAYGGPEILTPGFKKTLEDIIEEKIASSQSQKLDPKE